MQSRSKGEPAMIRRAILAIVLAWGGIVALSGVAMAQQRTPSPPGAKVFFVNLQGGETVTSPFKVEFGISGMTLAKAGTFAAGTGHHHLLVDTTIKAEDLGYAIPSDAQHIHFGQAQTETVLTLPPGTHTLQLMLADGNHIPFQPPVMSQVISVTVK
jgi:hypothetical protein